MTDGTRIFLIGLMGAGKTSIGRLLASELRCDFLDSDHEIENRTGVTIPHIFDIEGEEGFRKREAAIIDELTQKNNIVLATGGGAVLREENRARLKQRGIVIYLYANIDTLFERTAKDKNRPLLQTPDPRAKLQELFEVRDPIYRELADIIIDTAAGNLRHSVHEIQQKLPVFQ